MAERLSTSSWSRPISGPLRYVIARRSFHTQRTPAVRWGRRRGGIDLRLLSAHLEELPDAGVVGADAVLVVPAGVAEDVEGLSRGAQAVQVAGTGRLQGRGQNGVALVAGDAEAGTLGGEVRLGQVLLESGWGCSELGSFKMGRRSG